MNDLLPVPKTVKELEPALCLYPAIQVTGTLDAGSLLVALATLALALITWRLARTTKESVGQATLSAEAARESADAERASVEAMQMPYVIAIPIPYDELIAKSGEDYRDVEAAKVPREIHVMGTALEGLSLRMRLANIGAGPAITDGLSLVLNHAGDLLELDATQVPIAAGGWRDVDLPLAQEFPPENGSLSVGYRSANGTRYTTESEVTTFGRKLLCITFQRSAD